LVLQLSNNGQPIEVITVVDTGAEYSLISGELAAGIGLNLESGVKKELSTLRGPIICWSHKVQVSFFENVIEAEIRFSDQSIPRNLLGRDLLEHMQIGLREKHEYLYLHPQG
jgi:clan AA aspartic protease